MWNQRLSDSSGQNGGGQTHCSILIGQFKSGCSTGRLFLLDQVRIVNFIGTERPIESLHRFEEYNGLCIVVGTSKFWKSVVWGNFGGREATVQNVINTQRHHLAKSHITFTDIYNQWPIHQEADMPSLTPSISVVYILPFCPFREAKNCSSWTRCQSERLLRFQLKQRSCPGHQTLRHLLPLVTWTAVTEGTGTQTTTRTPVFLVVPRR